MGGQNERQDGRSHGGPGWFSMDRSPQKKDRERKKKKKKKKKKRKSKMKKKKKSFACKTERVGMVAHLTSNSKEPKVSTQVQWTLQFLSFDRFAHPLPASTMFLRQRNGYRCTGNGCSGLSVWWSLQAPHPPSPTHSQEW